MPLRLDCFIQMRLFHTEIKLNYVNQIKSWLSSLVSRKLLFNRTSRTKKMQSLGRFGEVGNPKWNIWYIIIARFSSGGLFSLSSLIARNRREWFFFFSHFFTCHSTCYSIPVNSTIVLQKGESQNKKSNLVKFSEKRTFLTAWCAAAHVHIRG